jgi:carbon monoxide dehydrogenase subunit G
MATLELSTKVGKPVETVFEFLTNIDNQKKLSEYISGIDWKAPLKVGSRYTIKTTSMGRTIETTNEVVSLEPNKKFGVKTLAAPPASDVTNTYLLEKDGSGTKLTLQVEAVLTPAGMPSMPGMEDMMKKQMMAGFESTLAAMKKAIEA